MTSRVLKTGAEKYYDVRGWEDRYQITISGKVRSKERYVNSPICGGRRLLPSRQLKTRKIKGYPAIQTRLYGRSRTIYIHRILAMLFIPNPDRKPNINHIDGCKDNNALSNLEWCTHKENMQHAFRTGLIPYPQTGKGEKCPAAKLNDCGVKDIKHRLVLGETQQSIASDYNVSKGTIGFIARSETWTHI